MIRHRTPLGWDRLEDRTCRSATATAIPTALLPYADSIPVADFRITPSGLVPGRGVTTQQIAATAIAKSDPLSVELTNEYRAEAASTSWNAVFLGDSIGYSFSHGAGAASWGARLAPLGVANFSLIGSTTNNVLYQVKYGGVLARAPRVAIIEAGIDNLGDGETVPDVIKGVQTDIQAIRRVSPRTKVLVLGLFPSNTPDTWLRADELEADAQLARLANGKTVRYANPGFAYVAPDGSIAADTSDSVHPNAAGYAVVADVIVPVLEPMLGVNADAVAALRARG